MKTVQISLNSIDKVKSFVNEITKYDYDFDLVSGRYVIDAKSIMGIFSLDLSKPIDLNIHAENQDADNIIERLKPYLVLLIVKYQDVVLFLFCVLSFLVESLKKLPFFFYYFTMIVSTVFTASANSSSIFSLKFSSDLRITSTFGLVTGCFATKIVQQSSYGRMEVS